MNILVKYKILRGRMCSAFLKSLFCSPLFFFKRLFSYYILHINVTSLECKMYAKVVPDKIFKMKSPLLYLQLRIIF